MNFIHIFRFHQCIKEALYPPDIPTVYLHVAFSSFRRIVFLNPLNDTNICPSLVPVCGEAMSQGVKTYLFQYASFVLGILKQNLFASRIIIIVILPLKKPLIGLTDLITFPYNCYIVIIFCD